MEIQMSLFGFVAVESPDQWTTVLKRLDSVIKKNEESDQEDLEEIEKEEISEEEDWTDITYDMNDLLKDVVNKIKEIQTKGKSILHLNYSEDEGDHDLQDIFDPFFLPDLDLERCIDYFVDPDINHETDDKDTIKTCVLLLLHSYNSVSGDCTFCEARFGPNDKYDEYFDHENDEDGVIEYSSIEEAFKRCRIKMNKSRLKYLSTFEGREFDFARKGLESLKTKKAKTKRADN